MASKSNTPGVGAEFEILVPAYFALLLNDNSDIENFIFQSNASEEFGNLDDVVIDIFLKNGKEFHFAIQLKTHTDKHLQADALEADISKKAKFSLKKYCKNFKEIEKRHKDYHFILFTDAKFGKENVKKVHKFKMFEMDDTSQDTEETQNIFNKILQHFNTSNDKKNNENIYKFKVIEENNVQNNENATTSKENNVQNNEETPTNGDLSAQNNEETPTNGAINAENNVETPTKGDINAQNNEDTPTNGPISAQNNEETPTDGAINAQNNAEVVTKEDFERFFSRLFLFVCQQNFRDFKQSILNILKEKTIYLKYEKLFRDWHQGNFTNKKIDKKTLNSHLVNFFLSSPLITSCHLSIDENTKLGLFNAIVKKFDLSIVNSSFKALEDGLGEPEDNFSLERIREKLKVYMKEYKIEEKELENDPQGESCLLRLAKEWKFVNGSTKSLDNETKLKILQYFFEEPIILEFSNPSSKELICLMLNLYKMEDNRIKLILLDQDFDNRRFSKLSVFKNLSQLESEFCQRVVQCCQISIQGRTVALKELIERHPEIIEWVEAIGIFQMLKGVYTVGVEETKTLPIGTSNIESKSSRIFEDIPKGAIKAVCTETGLGKSVMLQHLKNVCPLLYWIRGHTFRYYKAISDVHKFLNNSLKLLAEEKNIENFYLNGKQVAIFLDELDAVSSDDLKSVFDYINELCRQKYIVFVAARKCLLTKIVKRFGASVEIIKIEKLTKDEQEKYIRRNVERHEDFINNFLINENVYFGIPLFLTSENLLEQLRGEGRIPHSATLCSMYFKVLHQHLLKKIEAEKSDPDSLITTSNDYYIYGDLHTLQQNYEFPALQFLFGDEIFDTLKIQDKRSFRNYLSLVAKYNDPLGILNLDDDGKVVFEHASLAEYFAVNYFANNSDKFELLNVEVFGDDKPILKETYFQYLQETEKSGNGCRVAFSA